MHSGCCGPNTYTIVSGDPSVLIDGRPAAIKGSQTKHCGERVQLQ
ncbi:MAG: PAAR domain-containing protein [Candidatus Moduliflexus flocculans]|nr:PAAR domain-containing protein [Candidatus Moduliflexus flocculans]